MKIPFVKLTLDNILANFSDTIDSLEKLSTDNNNLILENDLEVTALTSRNKALEYEMDKAILVAGKLRAMIAA